MCSLIGLSRNISNNIQNDRKSLIKIILQEKQLDPLTYTHKVKLNPSAMSWISEFSNYQEHSDSQMLGVCSYDLYYFYFSSLYFANVTECIIRVGQGFRVGLRTSRVSITWDLVRKANSLTRKFRIPTIPDLPRLKLRGWGPRSCV